MSQRDSSGGLFGKVRKLTEQAGKVGREAMKTVGSAREVVQAGIDTSRKAAGKAGEMVNRDRVAQGIEMTSKGAGILAKGARMASKGADSLGTGIEKASQQMRKFSQKIKK